MSIPEELVSLINSQPDPRVLKRALAVKMTLQGFTHQEIMGAIQVCSGFISKWKQIYIDNRSGPQHDTAHFIGDYGVCCGLRGSQ